MKLFASMIAAVAWVTAVGSAAPAVAQQGGWHDEHGDSDRDWHDRDGDRDWHGHDGDRDWHDHGGNGGWHEDGWHRQGWQSRRWHDNGWHRGWERRHGYYARPRAWGYGRHSVCRVYWHHHHRIRSCRWW